MTRRKLHSFAFFQILLKTVNCPENSQQLNLISLITDSMFAQLR